MILTFCWHLLMTNIEEDPFQYRRLTSDQLINVYWNHRRHNYKSKAILNEMLSRIPGADEEQRELLIKTLANAGYNPTELKRAFGIPIRETDE